MELITASENGHLKIVKTILQSNVDVNAKNNNGHSSLMIASRENNIEIVRELILKGANVNSKNNSLMIASANGHIEVL